MKNSVEVRDAVWVAVGRRADCTGIQSDEVVWIPKAFVDTVAYVYNHRTDSGHESGKREERSGFYENVVKCWHLEPGSSTRVTAIAPAAARLYLCKPIGETVGAKHRIRLD